MKQMNLINLFIFLFSSIYCDLPIHCLKSDIVGIWEFNITNKEILDNVVINNCGH